MTKFLQQSGGRNQEGEVMSVLGFGTWMDTCPKEAVLWGLILTVDSIGWSNSWRAVELWWVDGLLGGRAQLEEAGHWRHAIEEEILSVAPFPLFAFFALWQPWGEQIFSIMPFGPDVRALELADHGIKHGGFFKFNLQLLSILFQPLESWPILEGGWIPWGKA